MPVTYQDLHEQLLETQKELTQQLETIHRDVREDGVGYSNHMADAGTEVFEQARDLSVARQLERKLDDVRHALKKFEEGIQLSKFCSDKLDETEKKVSILIKENTDKIKEQPFPLNNADED